MSSNEWPTVPLGEVVSHRKEFIQIDDLAEYKRCRVQLHAQGVVLRDHIEGALIKTKKQQVCRTNEFLVAEIDAKMGGFGLVPPELEGAVVSSHYFLFTPLLDRLDPQFLGYYCRTPAFRDQVESRGTTNYAAIRPAHVLGYTVPLPPLEEQRRIVARIDRLAGMIYEARELRMESQGAIQALEQSLRATEMSRLLQKGHRKITDAVILERGKFTHRPRNDPRFFGGDHPWIQIGEIESAGKYIENWNQTLNDEGLAISRKFPKGTVLISIAATIGAVGILGFDCCIPDSIVAATPREGVDAGFVYHYLGFLRTHLEQVAPQSAQKNINLQILSDLPFPDVPLEAQQNACRVIDERKQLVTDATGLLDSTRSHLDAMLPSILDRAFKGEL